VIYALSDITDLPHLGVLQH